LADPAPRRDDTPDGQHLKPVSLVLKYLRVANAYEVQSITNSTWYKPGDWLSVGVVNTICTGPYPNWSVTMLEMDFLVSLSSLIPK
jgi:hypothetical protein